MYTKSEIRENVIFNLKYHLKTQLDGSKIFCEELKGNKYSIAIMLNNNKSCVLACCSDTYDPDAPIEMITCGFDNI